MEPLAEEYVVCEFAAEFVLTSEDGGRLTVAREGGGAA
jgi:hypothetical protein